MPSSAGPARTTRSAREPTFGVEEEFLLVDTVGGRPVSRAPEVLDGVRRAQRAGDATEYKNELLSSQVEAASGICTGLEELAAQLVRSRASLSRAARRAGALLVPTGTPVLAGERPRPTDGDRYRQIVGLYADVVADYQVSGCHVHVGVPDRESAVAVVNHMRPWLPTLLALSANSPFRDGRDTGYASWRAIEQRHFPGSGVPPYFASGAAYEDEIARLVACGSLVDEQMSFWLVRPSLRFTTVEFRTADTTATAGEALLQAALSRALVRTALDDVAAGRQPPRVDGQVAAAAVWTAARYGVRGPAVHPWRERRVPALALVGALMDHVRPALEESRELDFVRERIAWTLMHGTGADRQRAAAADGPEAVVRYLAEQAVLAPGAVPAGAAPPPPAAGNSPGPPTRSARSADGEPGSLPRATSPAPPTRSAQEETR